MGVMTTGCISVLALRTMRDGFDQVELKLAQEQKLMVCSITECIEYTLALTAMGYISAARRPGWHFLQVIPNTVEGFYAICQKRLAP